MYYAEISGKPTHRRYRDSFLRRNGVVCEGVEKDSSVLQSPGQYVYCDGGKATISRFPKGIIAEIFRLTQLSDLKDFPVPHNDWCWLTVTHVCKTWREVALGTESLWSYIDIERLSGVEQMKVYLKRSGSAQLSVHYYHLDAENDSDVLSSVRLQCLYLALAEIPRIWQLNLFNMPAQLPTEVRSALVNNGFPALQLFVLDMDHNSQEIFDVKDLFDGQAPKLTEVSMSVNSPSWACSPVMRNLRALSICDHLRSLSVQETLSILSEYPNLEKLLISSMKNDVDGPKSDRYALPIFLPNLKYVELETDYKTLDQFCLGTMMPNLRGWDVHCDSYPNPFSDNWERYPRTLIPYLSKTNSCKTLSFIIYSSRIKILTDYPTDSADKWNQTEPWQSLSYSWDSETKGRMLYGGLTYISYTIDDGYWCSVRDLTVQIATRCISASGEIEDHLFRSEEGSFAWSVLLGMLPALRVLTVQISGPKDKDSEEFTVVQNSYHWLLVALQSNRGGNEVNGNETASVVCPQLEVLHLYGKSLHSDVEVSRILAACILRETLHTRKLNLLKLSESFGMPEQKERAKQLLETFKVAREVVVL